MELYPHQKEVVTKAIPVLNQHKVVYLIMEVRTGKTLTSFTIAKEFFKWDLSGAIPTIGFITKKKAIPSINEDFYKAGFNFDLNLTCINYERINELPKCDLYIIDEAHSCGQYPKPSIRTKELKDKINGAPCILLSGTPTPESYSQIFHQLWITGNSPFENQNFYSWANHFVDLRCDKCIGKGVYLGREKDPNGEYYNVEKKCYKCKGTGKSIKMVSGFAINDYSNAFEEKIKNHCDHLFISCSQEDAGFTCDVFETFITVKMNDISHYLYKTLQKDKVVSYAGFSFFADTPTTLINKLSQISGGTMIPTMKETKEKDYTNWLYIDFESETEIIDDISILDPIIFDDAKAVHIRNNYQGKRIAIYYRYKAELKLLESFFPKNTKSWVDFEAGLSDIFLCQIQSGREGISLRTADFIIMYNIDFSATSYWQVRARMQYKDRTTPANVVWLFSDLGIEEKIYGAVSNKKNFTVSYYKKISSVRKQSTSSVSEKAESQRVVSNQDNGLQSPWLAGSSSHERREDRIYRGESKGQASDTLTNSKARTNTCSWL